MPLIVLIYAQNHFVACVLIIFFNSFIAENQSLLSFILCSATYFLGFGFFGFLFFPLA